MKENWMNKLIELLNQFEVEKWENSAHWQTMKARRREWHIWQLESIFGTLMSERESRLSITSKSYWFIQRLVDNDKIDRNKFKEKNWTHWMRNLNKWFNVIWEWVIDWEDYSDLESILMLLSIQENPIQFLISILK